MGYSKSFPASLRYALGGFAFAAAALAGWQQLAAAGLGAHNTQGPVSFGADKIELQDNQNRVMLSGNVVINQGDLRLQAARATVAYADGSTLEIQRLDATGDVLVTRGNESARGAAAVYDFNKRVIVMTGGVSLKRGTDTLTGARLVVDLNTGLSSVDGRASGGSGPASSTSSGGRVSGTFSVPKNTNN